MTATGGRVVVCGPKGPSARGRRAIGGGHGWAWAHVGRTPHGAVASTVRAAVPDATFVDLRDDVKRVSESLRADYVEYVGALGGSRPSDAWWTSCVAEKNPYVSRAFFLACALVACRDLARRQRPGSTLLVIEDAALRRSLHACLAADGGWDALVLDEPRGGRLLGRLAGLAELVARHGFYLSMIAWRVLLARYRYRLHEAPWLARATAERRPICVLHAWVDRRAYDERSGEFRNPDFDRLAAYMERSGRCVAHLPHLLRSASYTRVARFVHGSEGRYLVGEAFLTPRDVARICLGALRRRPRRRAYPSFAGVDISDLLHADLWREWTQQRVVACLVAEAWVEGWKRQGLSIDRFIFAFEGQSWERAVCEALRRLYPEAKVIGHQPSGVPPFALNYFVSRAEARLAPLPDRIVTNGSFAARLLAESGYGASRVVCGGGLRQEYLRPLSVRGPARTRLPNGRPRVVVAPSGAMNATVELLGKVVEALHDATDLLVVIRCHPNMPLARVRSVLPSRRLPGHFHDATGSTAADILRDAAAIIYNDSTYFGVEGLVAGVPVIYVEPDTGLDMDCLGALPHLRYSARTPPDILRCVRQVLENGAGESDEGASAVRAAVHDLVGSVTERTFDLFAS